MCVWLQNRRGGGSDVLPLQKKKGGGAGKVLAIQKGGITCFGVVLRWVLEVSIILEGGTKGFHPLKRGA